MYIPKPFYTMKSVINLQFLCKCDTIRVVTKLSSNRSFKKAGGIYMKQIGKNFLGTVGVVVIIGFILLAPWLLSKIPISTILNFVRAEWRGVLIGMVVSYLGMWLTVIVEKIRK